MKDDRIRYFAENMDRLSRRDRVLLNNPVIMQGLGLAPIVIPASNVQNALILAAGVAMLLTPTRMIATALSQRMGFFLRALIYALTSGVVYFFVAWAMEYMFGSSIQSVGIYLPLLVMEPLILKRYESPKRERLVTSFKKGIATTVGFCVVLLFLASARELLAFGTIAGVEILRIQLLPMAALPAGGFIMLGLLAAMWRSLVNAFKRSISMGVKKLQ